MRHSAKASTCLSLAVLIGTTLSGMTWAQPIARATATPASPKPATTTLPSAPSAADQQMSARQSMEESIARQKAAIQTQLGNAPADGFFVTGWLSAPPTLSVAADCTPANPGETDAAIKDAADAEHLNPALISAVVRQESDYDPCAVSAKGAMGLMQLMPETAAQFSVDDPFDVRENIAAGARYLKQLLGRYKGDLRLALAAYNAGPKKVDGDPPAEPDITETQDYVDRIVKALDGASAETDAAIR